MGRAAAAASGLRWLEGQGGSPAELPPPPPRLGLALFAQDAAVARTLGSHGPGSRRAATSFFVDCRLLRVSPEEAEQARQTVGAEVPEEGCTDTRASTGGITGVVSTFGGSKAGAITGAVSGGITGIVGAAAGPQAGGITGAIAGGGPGGELCQPGLGPDRDINPAHRVLRMIGSIVNATLRLNPKPGMPPMPGPGVPPDPDHELQCAQLQGLFARKTIGSSDVGDGKHNLLGNPKGLKLLVKHSPSSAWFKCGVSGRKGAAELKCVPYEAVSDAQCQQKCDYKRQTFRTKCLMRLSQGVLGGLFSLNNTECAYVGHFGQRQPSDIMGKAVPYGVYILAAPDPVASAFLLQGPSAAGLCKDPPAVAAARRPSGLRSGDFLSGPLA